MRTSASNLGFDLEPAGSNERSEVNPSALEILAKIKKRQVLACQVLLFDLEPAGSNERTK